MYALADRLQVPLSVILAMPVEEFNGWMAFASVEEEVRKGGFDDP